MDPSTPLQESKQLVRRGQGSRNVTALTLRAAGLRIVLAGVAVGFAVPLQAHPEAALFHLAQVVNDGQRFNLWAVREGAAAKGFDLLPQAKANGFSQVIPLLALVPAQGQPVAKDKAKSEGQGTKQSAALATQKRNDLIQGLLLIGFNLFLLALGIWVSYSGVFFRYPWNIKVF